MGLRRTATTALGTLLIAALVAPAPAGAFDTDYFARLEARSIGPAGMSGRVPAIDVVSSDPRIVWVGAASGGVWKSTDAGLTFEPVFDDQPVHSIGALAIDPSNPSVVWVGTGEGNPRNSTSVGKGVFRTLDGGKTWQHLGLDATERIHKIALHPGAPGTAWVCALGREWGENPERGVFKTTDGGNTWTKVLYVDENTGCGDLAIDPTNPDKLFAGMWQFRRWPWSFKSGGPGSGLHVSYDGGNHWKRLEVEDGMPAGELGRIGLAISRSHPNVVYALVEAESSALLRSEDGGQSFTAVNSRWDVAPRPFYFNEIRVDPAWPNRVYSLDYQVRVSDDGGKTFNTLPGASWRSLHGDYHGMWINPADPRHLYVTNDGGIAESRDHGLTFRMVTTLPLAQYYHVGFDFETPYNVYGGLQDNGSWRGPSASRRQGGIKNHHFVEVGGGDGFDTLPDPTDSSIGYSMSQGGYLSRWNLRTGEQKWIRPTPPADGSRLRFNWNAGLAIDPFEPATIYYGSQFVHRSKDRGESWETISPDLTTNKPEWQKQAESGGLTPDVTAAENHTTILTIAPSPVERGVIWVGTDDGRVQVTHDGGGTWTSLEANLKGLPANTWISHVEASKVAGGEAFVVADNHRRTDWTPYVFHTTDYGKTWKSLATKELSGYALTLEQDPVTPDLLFLGTEFGLWVSFDRGKAWMPWKHGVPTASVMDLAVHPRDQDLIVATHGRALFILDDIRPLREMSAEVVAKKLHLFSIAPAQQHRRLPLEGGYGLGGGEFEGENRPYGALITFSVTGDDLPLPDAKKERERKKKERAEKTAATSPGSMEKPAEKAATKPETEAKTEDAEKEEDKTKTAAEAEIVIADASGKTLRTLKHKVVRGLNRAVWRLDRDAYKRPPFDEGPGSDFGGPEVPPGEYRLTVKFRGEEASGTLQVLADSTSKNTPADWQARWQTIERIGAANDRLVDALNRLKAVRADLDVVERKVRERARAAGEKDADKIAKNPLIEKAGKLKGELAKVEKKLWQPPETKGIVADDDAFSDLYRGIWAVDSSWDRPSASALAYLAVAEKTIDASIGELDKLLAEQVEPFRDEVAKEGITLFESGAPTPPAGVTAPSR